jgi:hypothetical protein
MSALHANAKTSRALVREMRESVAAQMILIRELSEQIQICDRRIRSLETSSPVEPEALRRAVDADPHLGRF